MVADEIEKYILNPIVDKVATISVGLIILWVAISVIQKYLILKIKDNDNRYRAKKGATFIGYILTIVLIAIVYSDKMGKFIVVLGVAGAGIAFALQEVIGSFAGWLSIMFGGMYKIGDRIQLKGIKGDVIDISVLRTTLMEIGQWVDGDLYNGRVVFVANSFVFKEPVFNYSNDFHYLWDEIKIPIQYGSNYDKVKRILLDSGKSVAGDLPEKSKNGWHKLQNQYRLEEVVTEPVVSLTANDNWVEFTLRYIVHYKKRRTTKTDLFTRILKEIDASKGEVKFPSTSFTIDKLPDLNVNIAKQAEED